MSTISSAPLLEAMFEIHWGETSPGTFKYSNQEQNLLPGLITAEAKKAGFCSTEILANPSGPANIPLPKTATYRFRKEQGTWPCLQLGLGIFTVNQVSTGYDWGTFKPIISQAFDILKNTDPEVLNDERDDVVLLLRYQDAFYPSEGKSISEYIKKHFNINIALPNEYSVSELLTPELNEIHFQFSHLINKPKGKMSISIVSAIINSRPGLIMETIVESKTKELFSGLDNKKLLEWVEQAHALQQHSFKTLIKKSAYLND